MIHRVFNAALRFGSLGSKLILVLYMGIYFPLSDIGMYGLVVASVAISGSVLGFRLNYFGARDLIGSSPENITKNIISQSVFYLFNYLAAAVVVLLIYLFIDAPVGFYILLSIIFLAALEHYAVATMDMLIALKMPTAANVLLFVRASFWPIPVIVLGYLFPEYRNVNVVLVFWCFGVLSSILLTGWVVRQLPWKQALAFGVDRLWIKKGIIVSLPIWIGGIGASAAQYAERFVVEGFLSRDLVGVISFYGSFSNAIFSVVYGAVFAFSFPKVVSYHNDRDGLALKKEAFSMTLIALAMAVITSVIIGVIVPMSGEWLNRPEFYNYSNVLWLMLVAICLRCASESVHYVLYARQEDRMIWVGSFILIIPSFGLNLVLVPVFGLEGVGYSAIGTSVFYGLWRLACLHRSNLRLSKDRYYE